MRRSKNDATRNKGTNNWKRDKLKDKITYLGKIPLKSFAS